MGHNIPMEVMAIFEAAVRALPPDEGKMAFQAAPTSTSPVSILMAASTMPMRVVLSELLPPVCVAECVLL